MGLPWGRHIPKEIYICENNSNFKSDDKSKISNYRHISLLNVVSTVLEKCFKLQLQEYLNQNAILSESQYEFTKERNSSDALI